MVLVAFVVVALASRQVGLLFRRFHLPLITGFLLTGILAGPFLLGLISESTVRQLRFVDQISLGFIAIAAGAELHLQGLKARFKSIAWVTCGASVGVFVMVVASVLVLAEVAASVLVGVALGLILDRILALRLPDGVKMVALLGCGFGVYQLSGAVRAWAHANWPFEVLLEPLLISMVGGFWVTN